MRNEDKMELTEEQLKQIVTHAIAENNKTLVTKEEAKHILKVMKDDLPQLDTSKLATKEEVKTALQTSKDALQEQITGITTDVKKLINKVFPEQTPAQKSKWFVFD